MKIDIIEIPAIKTDFSPKTKKRKSEFEDILEKYVMPLKGKTIKQDNGKSNTILKVDWTGIERVTSSGKKQKIRIEIFEKTIKRNNEDIY